MRLTPPCIAVLSCLMGTGGLAVAATRQTGPPDSSQPKLVLTLDGGNAYVFTDEGHRADIGPVRKPFLARGKHFNPHTMYLKLEKGALVPRSDPPAPPFDNRHGGWSLKGYDVVPCPDGDCPDQSTLETVSEIDPAEDCQTEPALARTGDASQDFHYLPDLLDLHPKAALRKNWQSRLAQQVVLRQGRLILEKAVRCFVFRRAGVETPKQALVNGRRGMRYEVPVREYVDFQFHRRGQPAVVAALRFTACKNRDLELAVTMPPSDHKQTRVIAHFRQFYRLIEGGDSGKKMDLIFVPHDRASSGATGTVHLDDISVLNPGSECPGARVGKPAAMVRGSGGVNP